MKKFYQLNLKKCRVLIILSCIFFSLFPNSILVGQSAVPFTTAGTNTWFCPAGVTSVTVECWGGGGAGGGATGSNSAGGGGAGGAYTKAIIAVSPGTTYNLFVGAGGVGSITAGASGGSSWFNTNTTLLAIGGTGGALASANNSSANGATAPVSGNIGGTTNFYGGNGGKGSGTAGSKGGGGGGSAGTASDGNDAVTSTGGTAVTNGGAGANGSTSSADGADATAVGGGGAGARTSSSTNRNGGNGFTGKVLISYTTPGTYKDAFQSMSVGSSSWCAGETRTVTVTVKNTGTAAWVDAARQDINIGIKWDADPDYLIRTDVLGLAAGATGTYTFTVTAPATAGTNHLTFDVVYEAVSWFAGNSGGVGPGNLVSQSVALTINALPGITTQPSASSQNLCRNAAATALSVVATGAGITYQWYSNTLASNSGGSIIPGATLASYTPPTTTVGTLYYYCIVSGTCAPAVTSNVSGGIIVNAQPTASAGGNQTICQNGTAMVSGAGSSNGTILWTHNGVGSISSATTLTPTYTAAAGDAGHTVTLTMTVSNSPCTAATATYSVIVNGLPTATAGGSQSICQSGTATVSGATASNGTILWSHNGSGSLTNATTSTPTYTAAVGDVGNTVTLTMTVTSVNACVPATASATYSVIVNGQPIATAGGSQTICQNGTATVSGAGSSNGTILWTHNGVGSMSSATTLTPTYTPAAGDAGHTVTLTMTVSNSPCTAATATYSVIVNGLPTATAGGSQSICQSGTATVSGATSTNGTILWTHDGTGSLANETTLTPIYTVAAGDVGNTVTLTMTVTSINACASATASASYAVIVKGQPTASAGGSQTICQNGTAMVSGAGSSNGTILWTHNGVGSISSATTLTPTYTPAAGDAGHTVTLTMTVSNSPCTAATATYSVIVNGLPTATAGGSQTICQNGTATVSGATSSNGTILWTHNGTGSLTNTNTLTPTYTAAAGDAGHTVTLTMTVTSNNACTPATATAIYSIIVKATPTATAGGSQTICQNGTATVSGATSANGTISWTENGAGSITSGATTLTPVYTAVAADAGNTITLTMTVTNSPCAIATATYTVFVIAKPTASAGGNQTICQNGAATVSGAGSTNGTISWSHNGAGSLTNATTLTPTYTAGAGDAGNTVTLTMTVTNSPCAVATATYSVVVKAQPTANAGTPVTMCSNSPADISTGATSANNTGTLWSTSGDGTFNDATVLNGTLYAPGPNDITAGTVTITLTATGNSPCGSATSSKIVTITQAATAIAGTTINTCSGSGAVNITTGASATNYTSVVWTKSGTGTLVNANSLTTATYTPSAADIAAGSVTLTLTATGSSPCGNAISTKILSIASAPTGVSITPSTSAICAGGNVSLTASATTSSTTNIAAGSDNFNGTPQYTSTGNTSVFFGSSKIFTQENSGYNDFLVTTWRTADGSKFMLTTAADFFGSTTSTLTSPVINTTNYSSLTLSFQHTYKQGSSGNGQVQFSPDGGTTWNTVQTYNSTQGSGNNFITVTIPAATLAAYINQTNLKIRFNYSSTVFFNTSWWAVDNVTLNGTPIPFFSWTALPAGATAGLPANAGTAMASNKIITVTPAQTTVYTLTATDQTGSCTSTTATATVTVNQKSVDPTSATASSATICNGGSTILTLNGGGNGTGEVIHWYKTSCGGTAVGTGNNISVSPTTTSTYFGRYEDGAPCNYTSACASVIITVNQLSAAPTSATASSTTICNGASTILTLNGGGAGTGEVIHWYFGSCGGTLEGTGNNLSVSPSITTTYYGRYEDGAPCNFNTICKSVTITVNQKSADPVSATSAATTICSSGSTILTLNGGGGGTGEVIHWYSGSCGGTPEGTGNNLSVSPSATTTYYGRYEDGAPCNYTSACASITITVNQPAVASISGNATICLGSSANITFTGTPNAAVTYSINGSGSNTINLGAGGSAVLNTGALITSATYSLVSVAYTAPPGCSQPAGGTVTITVTSGTWLGFTADWNDDANWCGGIPTATTDVTIPAGTPHDPVVSAALAMAHNIAVAPGATITVSGQTLQISGAVNSTNQVDASNGAIELNGTISQNINANTFINNKVNDLLISNSAGVTLGGAVDVYHSLTYGMNGAILNTGGYLSLKSNAAQTAWIGDMTNHTINGDVTVERYIATGTGSAPNHGKSWQLLAVPTFGNQSIKAAWQEGATATNIGSTPGSAGNLVPGYGTMITSAVANAATQPAPGFDVYTPAGPTMKIYDSLSANYYGTASTQVPVYNQRGYFVFVRGDRSVYTSTAAATPTILRTKGALFTPANLPPVSHVAANTFESVGNPYASAIDMRNITLAGGVTEFFQVWDPRLGGSYNYGAFQTFTKIGSDYYPTPGGGSYGSSGVPSNYIQSGQAFFVQSSGSSGTVSFTESCKANGSSLFTTPNPVNQVQHILRTSLNTINADGSTGSVVDGVLSQFDDAYNNTVDEMDARKSTNTGENLSIKTGGKLLVIERRQTINQQDTIFFNLTGERNQPYRFHFDAENLDPSVQGYLVDNYLNTRTSLSMTGSTDVNFTVANVTGSNAANRFMVIFEPLKALPVTFTSVKAYKKDKNINVEWRVDNEMNMKQYEVEKSTNGTQFSSIAVKAATANNGGSAVYVIADANPVEGFNYYRIKSADVNGKTSYTNVVKVLVGSMKQDITIYPNPVTDGMIHLQLVNQPAGNYNIRLLNKIGQEIVTKKISHTEGSSTELIKWNFNLAHGIYQLEVTGPGNVLTTISVIY